MSGAVQNFNRVSIRPTARAGQLQNLCSHCHLAVVQPGPWPDLVQSLLPSGPRLRRIVPRASGATFAAIPLARLRSYRSRGVARMDLGVPPRAPAATRAGPHIARQNRRRRLSEQAIPSARVGHAFLHPSRSRLKRSSNAKARHVGRTRASCKDGPPAAFEGRPQHQDGLAAVAIGERWISPHHYNTYTP